MRQPAAGAHMQTSARLHGMSTRRSRRQVRGQRGRVLLRAQGGSGSGHRESVSSASTQRWFHRLWLARTVGSASARLMAANSLCRGRAVQRVRLKKRSVLRRKGGLPSFAAKCEVFAPEWRSVRFARRKKWRRGSDRTGLRIDSASLNSRKRARLCEMRGEAQCLSHARHTGSGRGFGWSAARSTSDQQYSISSIWSLRRLNRINRIK